MATSPQQPLWNFPKVAVVADSTKRFDYTKTYKEFFERLSATVYKYENLSKPTYHLIPAGFPTIPLMIRQLDCEPNWGLNAICVRCEMSSATAKGI